MRATAFSADGQQFYVSTGSRSEGIISFAVDDSETWKRAYECKESVPGDGHTRLVATSDGRSLIGLNIGAVSSLVVYDRDAVGKLTQTQVFQTEATVIERERAELAAIVPDRPSPHLVATPGAVGVPQMQGARDLVVTQDGKYLFVPCSTTAAILIFRRNPKTWDVQFVRSYVDPAITRQFESIVGHECLAYKASDKPNANNLIAAGHRSLAWFNWDAEREELTLYRGWYDREIPRDAADPRPVLPCLHACRSMVFSRNGQFLFLASEDDGAVSVLELVDGDIVYRGGVNPPKPGAVKPGQALELALSPDGKHLFSRYSNCALRVHELDERYWK